MSMDDLYAQFPDVHPNIVLKTDVLRQGLKISESTQREFNGRDDILWRGFHVFVFLPYGNTNPLRSPSRHPRPSWPQPSVSASQLPPQHHEFEFGLTHKANFS